MNHYIETLFRLIANPSRLAQLFLYKTAAIWTDKVYLTLLYKVKSGRVMNFNNPQTFNEKLQWLKLYNKNPFYSRMVDKYEVKQYVAATIGEQYVIPTLGVWNSADEVDFDTLPNQFVLKCTHDSGSVIICKDKQKLDRESTLYFLRKNIKRNFYILGREWPYKNVEHRIIAEKFMVDESKKELKDYKIFCFGGEPRLIEVDFDRFTEHKRNIYDTDWNLLDLTILYPRDTGRVINRPTSLSKMLDLARKLSQGIPFIRVDFYVIGAEIYFGELTFFHEAGFELFQPDEWNKKLGDWIVLPTKIE